MRTENLEKCLSIYKKNDRSRYITLPEMRNFLKMEFNLKVTTKMKKPEVTDMFINNLSIDTYLYLILETISTFVLKRQNIILALYL